MTSCWGTPPARVVCHRGLGAQGREPTAPTHASPQEESESLLPFKRLQRRPLPLPQLLDHPPGPLKLPARLHRKRVGTGEDHRGSVAFPQASAKETKEARATRKASLERRVRHLFPVLTEALIDRRTTMREASLVATVTPGEEVRRPPSVVLTSRLGVLPHHTF